MQFEEGAVADSFIFRCSQVGVDIFLFDSRSSSGGGKIGALVEEEKKVACWCSQCVP